MSSNGWSEALAASEKHPRPDLTYAYGTAGFRTSADILDSVLYRVGLLAALRSKALDGKCIGVMVTASHNPEKDNGVKLVDPRGEMLEPAWEAYATSLANARSPTELASVLDSIAASSSSTAEVTKAPHVVYGYDTRPSCPALVAALEDGLKAMGAKAVNAGLVTTPQLHYLVRSTNTQGSDESYGEPTIDGYYKKLAEAFGRVNRGRVATGPVTVDCANGVGAPKLKEFVKVLGTDKLRIIVAGDAVGVPGALNSDCGADYVKTQQRAPPSVELVAGEVYCSFDGDADRVVFYYKDTKGTFKLLDGDKIAGLLAGWIKDLVADIGLQADVGVVQTAYANGSSTTYLEHELKVPVACVPTGVKHLHHAAQSFDVGVYFEANGHGTVLFSPSFKAALAEIEPENPSALSGVNLVKAVVDLTNETVGDALSDMLLVCSVLMHRAWGPKEWDTAYTDLPNRLVKVLVKDRNIFTTKDAERKVVTPEGLQDAIDRTVGKYERGRSFVRPSGTEDCVRVYAEAGSRVEADELAQAISDLVTSVAG